MAASLIDRDTYGVCRGPIWTSSTADGEGKKRTEDRGERGRVFVVADAEQKKRAWSDGRD